MKMVWRFLKHYGKSKAGEVLDEFARAVVTFDPEVATRAQIEMMEAELRKLGRRLTEAEGEVRREHQETAALRESFGTYLEAARRLEAKLAEGSDPGIEASLAKVVAKLEALKPEIEREEQEDREVEAWRVELRRSFEELGRKLKQAQGDLRSAHRQMDMVRLQKQRVEERDRRARAAAGMTSSISALSVALDAMNQQTAHLRAETETLQLRAGLFQAEPMESDPHIAAALEAVRGKAGPGQSLSERLAALDGRPSPQALTAAE
jgi:chromosome segregation ATPase